MVFQAAGGSISRGAFCSDDVTRGETRPAAITQQRVHEEGRKREESTENPPTTDRGDRQKTSIGHR